MKTTPRLFVDERLEARREVPLSREQGHYLTGVLRLAGGDPVRVFNGRDGEWLAHVAEAGRKAVTLRCERHIADVRLPPDVDYVFAPLKHARLDYVVQKATELGARRLVPVITQRYGFSASMPSRVFGYSVSPAICSSTNRAYGLSSLRARMT